METLRSCPICGSEKSKPYLSCKDYTVSRETFSITQCGDCGFRFTNPRPKASDLGRYYMSEDYISHSNSSKGLVNKLYKGVRNLTLKRKLKIINARVTKGYLLDIGCGTGEFLSVCQKDNWECLGVEPSLQARKYAIDNYGLKVVEEDKLKELPPASFDVITLWHVLEHVPLLNERMQEIKDLLKPKGIIIIAVPNCHSLDAEVYKEYWAAYDVPRHLYHFTAADIVKLATKHGLDLKVTLPMPFDSFYVSMLSEKYMNGKSNMLHAAWIGFKSNLSASNESRGFSSQIYILSK
jgi:2-polyprenyl-3-methyl-5-hydroxy-6-metoxy-1,4-benzoquinol methylase